MHIIRSHRMERLAEALAAAVAEPVDDPLARDVLVVPSEGLAQWATLEIARHNGVSAWLEVLLPRPFIEGVLKRALSTEDLRLDAWTRDRIAWALMELLPVVAADPRFPALARAVPAEIEQRFLLAQQLAYAFDQYAVFRPKEVLAWEAGAEPLDWQAELWRRLVARVGGQHTARVVQLAIDALDAAEPTGLPRRVFLLGVATLPPVWMAVLAALRGRVDVRFFQLLPTEGLMERGQDHPLLTAWSTVARDLQALLLTSHDLVESEADLFEEEGEPELLLHRLQRDLLELRTGGARFAVPVSDQSLQVFGCHAPVREVEVVRDAIRARLEADPTLRPRDIVVMAPDISVHGPLIEAVFGVDADDPLYVPWHIADRPVLHGHQCGNALLAVLGLLRGRCAAADVVDLLSHPPLRAHFAISDAEREVIDRLVVESGVVWGRDAAHRGELGQPEVADGTWRAGLDRLLLGTMVEGVRPVVVDGESWAPVADVEGDLADLAGRWAAMVGEVLGVVDALTPDAPVAEHVARVRSAVDRWFGGDDDLSAEVRQLRERLDALALAAEGFVDAVPVALVVRALQGALAEQRRPGGFLRGGVTVCEMLPMRAVPFRVVCVLGLSDRVFPRQDPASTWDLLRKKREIGDRSRRDDDRAMLLEAILSARDSLVLTAVTRSVKDDSPVPPSVLVDELLDVLETGYTAALGGPLRAQIVATMPLQPFSHRYVRPGGPITWDVDAQQGAIASRGERPARRAAEVELDALKLTTVTVADLERFVRNPSDWFFSRRLQLYAVRDESALPEREPIHVDALQRWGLGDRWLSLWRQGLDDAEIERVLRAEGRLSPGAVGGVVLSALAAEVGGVVEDATPWLALDAAAPRVVDTVVDAGAGPVRVVGELHDQRDGGQVVVTFSKAGKDNGRGWLPFYVRHVVRNIPPSAGDTLAMPVRGPVVVYDEGEDEDEEVEVPDLASRWVGAEPPPTALIARDVQRVWAPLRAGDAQHRLTQLVRWMILAGKRPICATADAAAAWWSASKGGVDIDAADRAAWKAIDVFHDPDALRQWTKRHGPLSFAQRRRRGEDLDVERFAREIIGPATAVEVR